MCHQQSQWAKQIYDCKHVNLIRSKQSQFTVYYSTTIFSNIKKFYVYKKNKGIKMRCVSWGFSKFYENILDDWH